MKFGGFLPVLQFSPGTPVFSRYQFSHGTSVFSTNKSNRRHNITEILLKVMLCNITLPLTHSINTNIVSRNGLTVDTFWLINYCLTLYVSSNSALFFMRICLQEINRIIMVICTFSVIARQGKWKNDKYGRHILHCQPPLFRATSNCLKCVRSSNYSLYIQS